MIRNSYSFLMAAALYAAAIVLATSNFPANTSRPLRNHNPLNIRRSANIVWRGMAAKQPDPEFVTFVSDDYGLRAAFRVLDTYIERHRLVTVRAIITRWAPPSENDTETYIRIVCADALMLPDEEYPWTRTERIVLIGAMARVESGIRPSPFALNRAYNMSVK